MKFLCSSCDQWHEVLPFCLSLKEPDYYFHFDESEKSKSKFEENFCITYDGFYFMRGRLKIPIVNEKEAFELLIWTSLSETSYNRMLAYYDEEKGQEPFTCFGWLANGLDIYDFKNDEEGVKLNVHFQDKECLPNLEVQASNSDIYLAQKDGWTYDKFESWIKRYFPNSLCND